MILYSSALRYMVSDSLSRVCWAFWRVMISFFVASMSVPRVPRMVMPRVFAKALAGSSSNRALIWFW